MDISKIVSIIIICSFIVTFILAIVSLKQSKKEWNKTESEKEKLVKNNKFIMERREKYEKIMNDNATSLNGERKIYRRRMIISGILFLGSVIIFLVFRKPILFILIPISIIIPGLIWGKDVDSFFRKSGQMYNETVSAILKEYDSNLDYYPTSGIKREEYYSLYFAEPCDVYRSSDLIINSQSGFCYADVFIETIDRDDEGTTYNVEFDGSLAKLDIANISCTIILGGLGEDSFKKSDSFKMIKFENDEFNKLFLCFSDNELVAYKILTPDVMEQFINIRNNSVGSIDIRIINDKLYIRFKGTNGFDGAEGSNDELFKSVTILDHIIKTMDNVKKLIESKNMN